MSWSWSLNSAKERRGFIRLRLPRPIGIKFKIVSTDSKARLLKRGRTSTRNISGSGMFLELPRLSEGIVDRLLSGKNRITLELTVPGHRSKIRIIGKAVWMDKKGVARRRVHGVGIRFVEITDKDRERLIYYMLDLILRQ